MAAWEATFQAERAAHSKAACRVPSMFQEQWEDRWMGAGEWVERLAVFLNNMKCPEGLGTVGRISHSIWVDCVFELKASSGYLVLT